MLTHTHILTQLAEAANIACSRGRRVARRASFASLPLMNLRVLLLRTREFGPLNHAAKKVKILTNLLGHGMNVQNREGVGSRD